jgi:hypothetical protein
MRAHILTSEAEKPPSPVHFSSSMFGQVAARRCKFEADSQSADDWNAMNVDVDKGVCVYVFEDQL